MEIRDLVKKAHAAAIEKGWYETPRALPELLMLTVSELSEVLEADRNGKYAYGSKVYMKDTVEDELADTFIRLADLCGYLEIDIESHIIAKMRHNETRPYKHGKRY